MGDFAKSVRLLSFSAPFNNMQNLKFKADQPLNSFFATVNQINVWRLLRASDYCRALFRCLNCAQRFDYGVLGSSRKLGGATKHLIDGLTVTKNAFVG